MIILPSSGMVINGELARYIELGRVAFGTFRQISCPFNVTSGNPAYCVILQSELRHLFVKPLTGREETTCSNIVEIYCHV